ncbi:MAG: hypothetical protein Ct9H90mP25_2440 [Gammaproteobacteria bacterium]|nr:MAG: hypothetical protein Ct9H90mP25_2440 [Gammaproteobacteria bacterium]
MHAVSCIPAVTGAWKYLGGGALYSNAELFPLDKSLIIGADLLDRGLEFLINLESGKYCVVIRLICRAARQSLPC